MPTNSSHLSAAERNLMKERMLMFHYEGKGVREIAQAVPCSVRYVYKQLPLILDQEAGRIVEIAKREIMTQIGRLNRQYSEVADQWRKSCENRTETVEKTEGEFPDAEAAAQNQHGRLKHITGTTTTRGLGDPRYIEQMRAIQADIRRLLRLDKDETLKEVLQSISLTQVNVTTQSALMPVTLPGAHDIAGLMAQFGMNPDGTAKPLPLLMEAAEEDVVEALQTETNEAL